MRKYVLDTNLYIDAARSTEKGRELAGFYARHLPSTYLHATVAQELLAGGRDRAARRRIEAELVLPFERRNRIVTPTWTAWKKVGELLAELSERGMLSLAHLGASFLNDAQIAASCREAGLTLVTRNTSDFERIRTVLPFELLPPWPS